MTTPAALFDPSAHKKGAKVWIPDVKKAWVGAEVYSTSEKKLVVRADDDRFLEIIPNDKFGIIIQNEDGDGKNKYKIFDLLPRNPDFLKGAHDLTQLSYLHEAEIMHNISLRFHEDQIYTYTGTILVAVNPWRRIPLYTPAVVDQYKRPDPEHPPHIFAVAQTAYSSMVRDTAPQAILVSGESGAGKTETCKLLMGYLGTIAGTGKGVLESGSIEDRIIKSNPLLEALGNARTQLNDNSSRFGKFTEILFDTSDRVCGARIETYLLEKSRVAIQRPSDRNFHIFYQLILGATPEEKREWHLQTLDDYHYLTQSDSPEIEGVSDADNFLLTRQSMDAVGISLDEQRPVFRIISAILHIGNINFEADKESFAVVSEQSELSQGKFSPKLELTIAAKLLGLDAEQLEKALCTRLMHTAGETLTVRFSVAQALDARDALAKALYSKLFDWIVKRINISLRPDSACDVSDEKFIGLLDISGFESFEENSFEQVCINYSNEKLQQLFNHHVFKAEQKVYRQEDIEWHQVDFTDNAGVLEMIEKKKGGLINLLDDQCMQQQGTDEGFVKQLLAQNGKDSAILAKARFSATGFVINHFAGEVGYEAAGFLDKNRDALHPDLIPCIQASTDQFVRTLFPSSAFHRQQQQRQTTSRGGAGAGGASNPGARTMFTVTVIAQFRNQLSVLMEKLAQCSPYFIRCIKPNSDKKPKVINGPEVTSQLRNGGVIDAVRIMKDMYPSRINHIDFYNRITKSHEWQCYLQRDNKERRFYPLPPSSTLEDGQTNCQQLCIALGLEKPKDYQIGRSKVFFRAGELARLETRLQEYLFAMASAIRKYYLRWKLHTKYKNMRAASHTIQRLTRGYIARKAYNSIRRERAAIKIQRAFRRFKSLTGFRSIVYLVRKRHMQEKRRKELEAKKQRAATTIQATWRAHHDKHDFYTLRRGVVRLQAQRRGQLVRRKNKIERGEKLFDAKVRLEAEVVSLGDALTEERQAKVGVENELSATQRTLATNKDLLEQEKQTTRKLEEEIQKWKQKYEDENAMRIDLERTRDKLENDLQTSSDEWAATKSRLEGNIAYLKEELESAQSTQVSLSSVIDEEKHTAASLLQVISHVQIKAKSIASQARHFVADAKLETTEMLSALQREMFAQLDVLRGALEKAWAEIAELRDDQTLLSQEHADLQASYEKLIVDLENTEQRLAEETTAKVKALDKVRHLEGEKDKNSETIKTKTQMIELQKAADAELRKHVAHLDKRIIGLKSDLRQKILRERVLEHQLNTSARTVDYEAINMRARSSSIANAQKGAAQKMPTGRDRPRNITAAQWQLSEQIHGISSKSGMNRSGWLSKEGGRIKTWKKRWVVLTGDKLSYFKSPEDTVPRGVIALDNCFVAVASDRDAGSLPKDVSTYHQVFRVTSGADERKFYFVTESPEQAKMWLQEISINIALNTYVKKMCLVGAQPDPRVVALFGNLNATSVVLNDMPITLESMVALSEPLQHHKHLADLSLQNAELDMLHMQVLTSLLEGIKSLTSLDISRNKLGPDGSVMLIKGLAKCPALTTLDISENMCGDDGAEELAKFLKINTKVTSINLTGNQIGDKGAKALCAVLAEGKHKIEVIKLGKNNLGDESAEALAKVIAQNKSVTKVVLHSNFIGDDGCCVLAKALIPNETVVSIDLARNPVGDRGGGALLDLCRQNKVIREIDVGNFDVEGRLLFAFAHETSFSFPSLVLKREEADGDDAPGTDRADVDWRKMGGSLRDVRAGSVASPEATQAAKKSPAVALKRQESADVMRRGSSAQ